jgi:hypothetical protein
MASGMSPARTLIALMFAGALIGSGAAWAGGGSFGNDEDTDADNGPSFFGFVKDKNGDPVDDAKITVAVKSRNSTMIVHADSQGHFLVKGFDKTIDPDEIEISCSKEGYREVAHSRRPSADPSTPVEVSCILQHD